MSNSNGRTLFSSLAPYAQNTPLLDLIANSAGHLTFQELSTDPSFAIEAHVLEASDDLFTLWLLTNNRIVLFQSTRLAQSLAVSIPISRIRRVVNEVDTTTYLIRLEIEADRNIASAQLERNDNGYSGTVTTLPSSYVISGPLSNYGDVLPFYISLNNKLA